MTSATAQQAEALHHYSLFGLRIASEMALPELRPAAPGAAEVLIERGPVAEVPQGFSMADGDAYLNAPDTARYRVRGGAEIRVDVREGASGRDVRTYLLGSAMGTLLHQRRLLPLHGCAIEIAGKAVVFVGHSGAGKSTLAAWFNDRGHRIVADDVSVVTLDGGARVEPGIARIRLWRDALEASGRAVDGLDRSFDGMDKYDVGPDGAGGEAMPLGHICLLRRGTSGEVRPLSGVAAVDALVSNTYRGNYLRNMGGAEQHLRACMSLASAVPISVAERRWGFDLFADQARALECAFGGQPPL